MASIYDLKPRFQALLRPLTRWLAARGVTANQVTLAVVAVSVATGLFVKWADGVAHLLPRDRVEIEIEVTGNSERRVAIASIIESMDDVIEAGYRKSSLLTIDPNA